MNNKVKFIILLEFIYPLVVYVIFFMIGYVKALDNPLFIGLFWMVIFGTVAFFVVKYLLYKPFRYFQFRKITIEINEKALATGFSEQQIYKRSFPYPQLIGIDIGAGKILIQNSQTDYEPRLLAKEAIADVDLECKKERVTTTKYKGKVDKGILNDKVNGEFKVISEEADEVNLVLYCKNGENALSEPIVFSFFQDNHEAQSIFLAIERILHS